MDQLPTRAAHHTALLCPHPSSSSISAQASYKVLRAGPRSLSAFLDPFRAPMARRTPRGHYVKRWEQGRRWELGGGGAAPGSPALPGLEKMAPAGEQGQGVAPATAPRRVGPRAGQGWLLRGSCAGARGRRCTRPPPVARRRGPSRPRSLCPPWRWRMTSVSLGRVEGGGGLAPLSVCFPPGLSLPSRSRYSAGGGGEGVERSGWGGVAGGGSGAVSVTEL